MLELRNISKTFGGLRALTDVSLTVQDNEIVGLIGPNGAGKTTLFSIAAGFQKPDAGDVILRDEVVTGRRADQIARKGMSRTFQIPQVFVQLSVEDNVLTGALSRERNVNEATKISAALMEQFGLAHIRARPAGDLSVLERKKVEIARALATQPQMLLLDEVMAGLRPGELEEMIASVQKIHQERSIAIVIVEHVIEAVWALASRVAVLDQGQLIAIGEPDAIRENLQVIAAYLGSDDDV